MEMAALFPTHGVSDTNIREMKNTRYPSPSLSKQHGNFGVPSEDHPCLRPTFPNLTAAGGVGVFIS